jgi:hypothetical protein
VKVRLTLARATATLRGAMPLQARLRPLEAALLALVMLAGAIAIYAAFYAIASAPYWDWNAGKLAPLVAFARRQPFHYQLYQDPHGGVMTAWIYGPIPAFIFAPATLFDRPTPAIMLATVINAISVLLPAAWFLRVALRGTGLSYRSATFVATSLCFMLWTCLAHESIRQVTFMVMPDGPALGFAICACGCVLRGSTMCNLACAAICAALSVWCKQTMLPFLLVPPLHLLIMQGWKVAMRLVAVQVAVLLLISLVLILSFGGRNMWFHMITLPASHPWRGQEAGKVLVLVLGMRDLLRDAIVPLGVLFLCLLIAAGATWRRIGRRDVLRLYREEPWLILVLAAVSLVPPSVFGYVKVGGYLNNFGLTTLFILLAATTGAAIVMTRIGSPRATWTVALVLCVLITFRAARVSIIWHQLPRMAATIGHPSANQQEIVYRYAKSHPGVVYFPWNTLSTLLAEGTLYHFEWGVHDRIDASLDPTPSQILAHIPPRLQYVAYHRNAQSSFAVIMFPRTREAEPIDDLPEFVLFAVR